LKPLLTRAIAISNGRPSNASSKRRRSKTIRTRGGRGGSWKVVSGFSRTSSRTEVRQGVRWRRGGAHNL